MPSRRPLPCLSLIAVFKQLTPNDQLNAARMSPRSRVLVRAANRRVKMLVVTSSDDIRKIQTGINLFSLSSRPGMQLLTGDNDHLQIDYPLTTGVSIWNCLILSDQQVLDSAATEQIVNAFSALTELKIVKCSFLHWNGLQSLLLHSQWATQLTNLMVSKCHVIMNWSLVHSFATAINGLSALEYFAISWDSYFLEPLMPILAQLKVIAIHCFDNKSFPKSFLQHSFEKYAQKNAHLKIHLLNSSNFEKKRFSRQPDFIRNCIVRYGSDEIKLDQMLLLSNQLPSLISLQKVYLCFPDLNLENTLEFFTVLSKFEQLIHLSLEILEAPLYMPSIPLAQLPSIKTLDLSVCIVKHNPVTWLNFLRTLPNLQTIYLHRFNCLQCDVEFWDFLSGEYDQNSTPNFATALKCLQQNLPNLHPGVHPKNIIFESSDKQYYSLEQFLFAFSNLD